MQHLLSNPAMTERPRLALAMSGASSSGASSSSASTAGRCSWDGAPMSPLLRSAASAARLASARASRAAGELCRAASEDFSFTPCPSLPTALSEDWRAAALPLQNASLPLPDAQEGPPFAQYPISEEPCLEASSLAALASRSSSGGAKQSNRLANPFDMPPELPGAAACAWK